MTTAAQVTIWRQGSWDSFLSLSQQTDGQKAKAYYFHGAYQFTMGVGANHGDINAVILLLLSFYCTLRNITFRSFVNTSYRKEGVYECQPDLSFYFSNHPVPSGSGIVNLDEYPPPDLVIEIADASLTDDLGIKRMLYEEMQVREYWVIDGQKLEIFAFAIDGNLGSRRIAASAVLGGLPLDTLVEALRRSRAMDHGQLGRWWLETVNH